MPRRTFLAMIVLLGLATTANAGTVYLFLAIDPPTAAGFGVATVPGPNGTTMGVTSSRSGTGTFHLFAVDDADNSAGIRSFVVKLNGTITAGNNRSPQELGWDTATFDGPFNEGFNDVRTAQPSSTVFGAGQAVTNNPPIDGYGQTASNFVLKTPSAASMNPPVSGEWGVYPGRTSGF